MVQKYLLTLVIDDNELDASQAKLNKYLETLEQIKKVRAELNLKSIEVDGVDWLKEFDREIEEHYLR